jgi:hypothetical protein
VRGERGEVPLKLSPSLAADKRNTERRKKGPLAIAYLPIINRHKTAANGPTSQVPNGLADLARL